MTKTALIVDDSKSARVVLKRLLESHSLNVDTAESAEAALEYLVDHRPDVVFMDHLMPGMDGFEAVSAIKNNPDTATIPIMMYTSQQGEVYVGQARALGAVGVLPKQVEPVEVSKVLRSLRVIGDESERRRKADGAGEAPDLDVIPGIERFDKQLRLLIQDLFEQQRAILRRDLLDSYETIAARVADEFRPSNPEDTDVDPGIIEKQEIPGRLRVAVAILAVVVVIFISLYWMREQSWQEVLRQNADLRSALAIGQNSYTARTTEIRRQLDEYQASLGNAYGVALSSIEWGANQAATYAFGDIPFGDARLAQLKDVAARLMELDFVGVVRLESHVGDFCMIQSGPDSHMLAPSHLDVSLCDATGFSEEEAAELGQRQSVSFANFISVSAVQTGGRIDYEIESHGNRGPALPYPNSGLGVTAGRWNEIAAANNRVIVSIIPDDR